MGVSTISDYIQLVFDCGMSVVLIKNADDENRSKMGENRHFAAKSAK